MSHNISDAVFSAREGAGWTGLGFKIDPSIAKEPRKIAELCNALWTVIQRDLYVKGSEDFDKVDGYAAQVRSDNGRILSVTSDDRYHTDNRQPVDIFEAFRDALAAEELEISHAAILRGGKIITVCATHPGTVSVGGDVRDIIQRYTTLATGYDKAHGTKGLAGGTRVVCNNTYDWAVQEAGKTGHLKSIRASSLITDKAVLVDLIRQARDGGERVIEKFNTLANTKLTDQEVTRFFATVLKIDVSKLGVVDKAGNKLISTRAENALKALVDSYRGAPGAQPGTAWGAFNAVTHYATHVKTVRDTMGDGADAARLASNMFGDSQQLKARALALLTERVAA